MAHREGFFHRPRSGHIHDDDKAHFLSQIQMVEATVWDFLYCHIQRALHDELECSLAVTPIVPIYTIKRNMANKYKT